MFALYVFLVSTEKGGEKEKGKQEKRSWPPNRQLPCHFQLDLVIPDGHSSAMMTF